MFEREQQLAKKNEGYTIFAAGWANNRMSSWAYSLFYGEELINYKRGKNPSFKDNAQMQAVAALEALKEVPEGPVFIYSASLYSEMKHIGYKPYTNPSNFPTDQLYQQDIEKTFRNNKFQDTFDLTFHIK